MNWKDKIKRFYDNNLWTKEMVADAISYGKITVVEYEEITGEVYIN